MKKKILNYRVIFEQDEDGVYIATAPSLQGCYAEGKTFEEAEANIREALELNLEVRGSVTTQDDSGVEFVGVKNIQEPVRYGAFATT